MPDLEEILRADGAAWRTDVDARRPKDEQDSLSRAVGRARHRRWRPVLAAASVVLVVGASAAYLGTRGGRPGTGAESAPVSQPSTGIDRPTDDMFTVAAPDLSGAIGPGRPPRPNCVPDQIDATAELRESAYGIVGVVEMHGHACSIPMYPGPSALTDAAGRRLAIPVAPRNDLNGANIRPDLSFADGAGAWGFAIDGSWCGAAPAAVVVPLTENPRASVDARPSLTVPLTGPRPNCTGTSNASLVRGVPGAIGDSVLPTPEAWSSLKATLRAADAPPYLQDLSVTLTNSSDVAVRLSPCPRFGFAVDRQEERSSSSVGGPGGLLPCNPSTVVPAHGQLTIQFSVHGFGYNGAVAMSTTIRFAIAGGASATVTRPAN